jgi:hypothetical protein
LGFESILVVAGLSKEGSFTVTFSVSSTPLVCLLDVSLENPRLGVTISGQGSLAATLSISSAAA